MCGVYEKGFTGVGCFGGVLYNLSYGVYVVLMG